MASDAMSVQIWRPKLIWALRNCCQTQFCNYFGTILVPFWDEHGPWGSKSQPIGTPKRAKGAPRVPPMRPPALKMAPKVEKTKCQSVFPKTDICIDTISVPTKVI